MHLTQQTIITLMVLSLAAEMICLLVGKATEATPLVWSSKDEPASGGAMDLVCLGVAPHPAHVAPAGVGGWLMDD